MTRLIGHVSDEQDMALADVVCEFQGADSVAVVRSASSGAVYADLSPGKYDLVLAKDGFGSKTVAVTHTKGEFTRCCLTRIPT